jgi:hypothetical protein
MTPSSPFPTGQPYCPHPDQFEDGGPSTYIVSPPQVGKETNQ